MIDRRAPVCTVSPMTKAQVAAILSQPLVLPIGPDTPEAQSAEYEERAAILEYGQGYSEGQPTLPGGRYMERSQAEAWARARQLVLSQRRQPGQRALGL